MTIIFDCLKTICPLRLKGSKKADSKSQLSYKDGLPRLKVID